MINNARQFLAISMETLKMMTYIVLCVGLLNLGHAQHTDYEEGIFLTMHPDNSDTNLNRCHLLPDPSTYLGEYDGQRSIVVSFNNNGQFRSCDVDYMKKFVYLYDMLYGNIILLENFDWNNEFVDLKVTLFQDGVSKSAVKLAIDWVSNNLYWTDPVYRWIAMRPGIPVNGTVDNLQYKVIVNDMDTPVALAVDPINGWMFWSDVGSVVKIERASLTGAGRKAIISKGLASPMSIAVDHGSKRIYWVDNQKHTIESSDFVGGHRRMVIRLASGNFFDIAIYQSTLVVSDIYRKKVLFIKKDGNFKGIPYEVQDTTFYGVAMYSSETQPRKTDFCEAKHCSDICVNIETDAVCLCREGFQVTADGTSCKEDTGSFHRALVVSDGQKLCIAGIQLIQTSFPSAYPLSCFFSNTQISDRERYIKYLEIDMAHRQVMFATSEAIYTVNIDEENPTPHRIVSSQHITGLALDWLDGNIYWCIGTSNMSNGRIKVIPQDIRDEMDIIYTNLQYPRDLIVIPHDRKLVWICKVDSGYEIQQSSLNGNDRSTIVSSSTEPKSLTHDLHFNRIYWIEQGIIKSANMTGGDPQTVQRSSMNPDLLLIYKGLILWTETSAAVIKTIHVNKQAPIQQSVTLDGINVLQSIKILDDTLQQTEKGPCVELKGGCEQICIPVGRIGVCSCQYGYFLDADKQSCSSTALTENFLLVSDETTLHTMYQVPLTGGDAVAVDFEDVGEISGLAVNPYTQTIIWGDARQKQIRAVHLNGTGNAILDNTGTYNVVALRFAIDYSAGNIFYTTRSTGILGFDGVVVLSTDGYHRTLVKMGATAELLDIVVHPSLGKMFFTNYGTSPAVFKANMDGSNMEDISYDDIKWPHGLAIDYEASTLYIADRYSDTIQRCTYNGVCTKLFTDPSAELMDVDISGQFLYYTALNRPHVTKLNTHDTNDVTHLAANAEMGQLDALAIYTTNNQPVHQHCSQNGGRGDCSTFCLPRANGHTCACQDGVSLLPNGNVCDDVTTTTTVTTTTPSDVKQEDTSSYNIVPVAAGVTVGGLVIVIVVVGIILFKRRSIPVFTGTTAGIVNTSVPSCSSVEPQYADEDAYTTLQDVMPSNNDQNATDVKTGGNLYSSSNLPANNPTGNAAHHPGVPLGYHYHTGDAVDDYLQPTRK